jgi:hypothetical protein
VPQLGASVQQVWSSAPTPSPTGGTLTDGIYVLQAVNVYGQCPGALNPVASTIYVCGNNWQQNGVSNGVETLSTTYASFSGGSHVTLTATCGPAAGMLALPDTYTVNGATLLLYFGTAMFAFESVYDKVQ